ncbi:uncharacterized protein V6R79_019459 [Siganus canaliculatus]
MAEQQGIESLKPGDLIEIFRTGYQHWAIYIGYGEVVHLCTSNSSSSSSMPTSSSMSTSSSMPTSSSSSSAVVKRHRIQDVTKGDRWTVNNLLDHKFKPREEDIIVKEAINRVDEMMMYSVTTYNCEHFVTKLRYGKAESQQIIKVLFGITVGAAAIATAPVTGAAVAAAAAGVAVVKWFSRSSSS